MRIAWFSELNIIKFGFKSTPWESVLKDRNFAAIFLLIFDFIVNFNILTNYIFSEIRHDFLGSCS